ncbi:MAG TPA: PQQ-binding-like beta-propeller repeat protein [Bryobacteraceae bacterium]|nr:PQQ-binding-like beta-propeller repeat protein [Bryobacteraceae bacterium]
MLLLLLSPVLAAATADEWPQWRGPHRDGALESTSAPASWPEHLQLRWKLTVGEGHSSPVLAGGRIFVFTRQQGKEVVSAIDPASGRILWQQSYPAPYKMNPAAESHGEGPKSTPVFHDGKLYTLGISGILTCWDGATGARRWQQDFSKQYRQASPLYGTAMSPVVDHGLLIAHVGGHDDGALTAFDANSGEVKWRWTGDGPAYASPIVADLGGSRQVITETQNHIVGISVAGGQLLWDMPFTTEYVQNIPSPLLYGDLVIVSGLEKGVFAVRPAVKDGKWTAETVWRNRDVSMYMSSPVSEGDLIFGFSHYKKGQFFCLDAHIGATRWTSPPRQGDNAAILSSGGNLILLKDRGELVIAKAGGKDFEPLRTYTVADSPTWAHPLVLRDGVVIKDATTLAFWSAT